MNSWLLIQVRRLIIAGVIAIALSCLHLFATSRHENRSYIRAASEAPPGNQTVSSASNGPEIQKMSRTSFKDRVASYTKDAKARENGTVVLTSLCSQGERTQMLARACAAMNLSFASASQVADCAGHLLQVDDKHQLMYAGFEKAGSSTWRAILIQASGLYRGKKLGMVHSNSYMKKHGIRSLNTYTREEAIYRLENYHKFIVVRHPYDRLVSAWRDKFIMPNGPFRGRGKIISRLYNREQLSNSSEEKYWKDKAFFSEWLRYLSQNQRYRNIHWNPYFRTMRCVVLWDAIVKLETADYDSVDIFRRLEYNQKLPVFHSHQDRSQLYQIDKVLPDFVGVDEETMRYLRAEYGRDLKMYGYDWDPDTLTATCRGSPTGLPGDVCC